MSFKSLKSPAIDGAFSLGSGATAVQLITEDSLIKVFLRSTDESVGVAKNFTRDSLYHDNRAARSLDKPPCIYAIRYPEQIHLEAKYRSRPAGNETRYADGGELGERWLKWKEV